MASSNRNGAAIELCRTLLSPDPRRFSGFSAAQSAAPAQTPQGPRANHLLRAPGPHPRRSRHFRLRSVPKTPEDAGFLAGTAFAARHPITCPHHPIGRLWRQRLALANSAALALPREQRGRSGAATGHRWRDAWYLRRAAEDPGPAGRLLQAWRLAAKIQGYVRVRATSKRKFDRNRP